MDGQETVNSPLREAGTNWLDGEIDFGRRLGDALLQRGGQEASGRFLSIPSFLAEKDILEFVQNSNNIINADSNDENETNDAAPVPTSSKMRNVMKSMRSYLDAFSNGEMNNQMDDNEQLVDNLMLKKTMQRKIENFPDRQLIF
ncbi:hypothetical protein TNCV_1206511 [Trichonephila clavipes]|nr:hypothetical protein TNCV_1206511 [Trichonephila clavipes]